MRNVYWSRMSVCLSLAAFPHYCTALDVTWANGRGCPLVMHYLADSQSVHGFRCYDNIAPNMKWQRVLVLTLCLVFLLIDAFHKSRAELVSIFNFGWIRFSFQSQVVSFVFLLVSVFVQHHNEIVMDGSCDTALRTCFCNMLKNKYKQMLPAFTSSTINVRFSLLHEINHATF